MSEAWAIALFTILTTCVGAIAGLLWRHIDQCKSVHSKLADITGCVKRIQEDIGSHETGLRGEVHEHTNALTHLGGCLWVIADKLGIKLPKRD